MLRQHEFYFTDVRFLNDSREFRQACALLEASVNFYAQQHRAKWLEKGCDPIVFDRMTGNMARRCEPDALFKRVTRFQQPFVFSLSEERDALSQWRGYGNGEYCIGFDCTRLMQFRDPSLSKVQYVEFGKPVLDLSQIFNRFYDHHVLSIRPDGSISPEVFHDGIDDILAHYNQRPFFVEFKDQTFREENEWRLVIQRSPYSDSIFFDPVGPNPIPRVALKSLGETGLSGAISEVICGPAVDFGRASAAIRMMLQQSKMESSVKITATSCSFRPR